MGRRPLQSIVCHQPTYQTYFYYSLGYTSREVAVQTNYPPATINGIIQNCTLQNGWCVTTPQVQITANEPVSGYQILLIEGIYNQEIFACQDNPCNFPLNNEGDNNLEYWAISSWGDTSLKSNTNVKVDTVAPNINLQVNGTMGQSNWYTTNTNLTAIGQDDTSGILESLLSVDGGTYMPSTTLSDGVYHIDVIAKDNALNTSTASATLQVDTVTPTLSLTVNGTKGQNGYYTSSVVITPTANDTTSGVNRIEVSLDGGATWSIVNRPLSLSDGVHTYQFRVYDNAGNMTESPMQHIQIDSIPPAIDLTDVLDLGDTFEYHLQDDGSGLAVVRIVIEDEDERFPAVIWDERLTGNKFNDDFIWDGKWADKNYASVGEYIIFVKATDRAGNESIRYGLVTVNPLSYFQPIPEFIPPVSDEITSDELTSNDESTEQNFGGGTSTNNNESTTQTLTLNISATAGTSASTSTTSTPSNILLGAVAATAIGVATAYALEQQKKRDEEEEKSKQQAKNQADQMNQAEADRKSDLWQAGQDALNDLIDKLERQGASVEDIAELREQGASQGFGVAINNAGNAIMQNIIVNAMQADMTEEERYEAYIQTPEYIARQEALAEWQAQQEQERLNAVYAARWAGIAQIEQDKEKPVNTRTITASGGLFGPPMSGIQPQEIEGEPPINEVPPKIQTRVEALGIATDLLAYISFYEMPKSRNDYDGTVHFNPFAPWNPTPAPIPYKTPDPSILWWIINGVQIKNSSYENIYINKINISINSDDFEDSINVYPPFTPLDPQGDYNLVQPNTLSNLFEINNNNLIPPNGDANITIYVTSETQRYGLLNINIKP